MSDTASVVKGFYRSIRELDVEALVGALSSDFVGHITPGVPRIGGSHRGPDAMLADCWIPAFRHYAAVPEPELVFEGAGDRVVALGRYRGAPPGGSSFVADFAHVFTVRDGKIRELRQVTDSRRWVDALDDPDGVATVVRDVFDAVRAGDLDALLELYSPDITIEDDPALPYGGRHVGRGGALRHAVGYGEFWDRFQEGTEFTDPREEITLRPGGATAVWFLGGRHGDQVLRQRTVSLFEVHDRRVTHLQMLHADTAGLLRFAEAGTLRST